MHPRRHGARVARHLGGIAPGGVDRNRPGPGCEHARRDVVPGRLDVPGDVGDPVLDPATVLVRVGADEPDLDEPGAGRGRDGAPTGPALRHGVHAVRDDGQAETQVVPGHPGRGGVPDLRRRVDGERRLHDGLLDRVDPQVHGTEVAREEAGERRLAGTGQPAEDDEQGRGGTCGSIASWATTCTATEHGRGRRGPPEPADRGARRRHRHDRVRPGARRSGRFYLGFQPRDFFDDPAESDPVDLAAEAEAFAEWALLVGAVDVEANTCGGARRGACRRARGHLRRGDGGTTDPAGRATDPRGPRRRRRPALTSDGGLDLGHGGRDELVEQGLVEHRGTQGHHHDGDVPDGGRGLVVWLCTSPPTPASLTYPAVCSPTCGTDAARDVLRHGRGVAVR